MLMVFQIRSQLLLSSANFNLLAGDGSCPPMTSAIDASNKGKRSCETIKD